MPSTDPPDKSSSAQFVKPFLYALNRMQERESLRPQQLESRALALLAERFGPSDHPAQVRFASGCAGLMSEHTRFFDGFALMMPLPMGTAVAVRRADGAGIRVAFEGTATLNLAAPSTGAGLPLPTRLVQDLASQEIVDEGGIDIAVVTTSIEQRTDSYLAALGVALARALSRAMPRNGFTPALVAERIGQITGRPFTSAYTLAVWETEPNALVLVDTGTQERLPVDAPAQDVMGWGLLNVACAPLHEPDFYRPRQERAAEALHILREHGFPGLTSYRTLEHRDLQQALSALPSKLRPLVRYLVGENRRVQKIVAALRRQDWQMFGALLLMSHASKRSDLGLSCPEADFVVEAVEQKLIDGLYGAVLMGCGGSVLIAGQPYVIPQGLDQIQAQFRERFGSTPGVALL